MKQTECKVTVAETAGEYSPHKLLTLAAKERIADTDGECELYVKERLS